MNMEISREVSNQAFKLQTNASISRVSSMPQLALTILRDYGLIQIPVEDKYWSGAIYVRDDKTVPVINTALPRANQYFTAWHEIYHLLFDTVSFNHIIENENVIEERKAEYFASCMLLRGVDEYFVSLPAMDFENKIFYCMSAFQAPYKAVLIALYEDAVKSENKKMQKNIKEILDVKFDDISDRFQKLGLDDSLVRPSYVVNTSYLQEKINANIEENPDLKYHADNMMFLENIKNELQILTK